MKRDLSHNLVLPTLLFAALGAMAWAVRGTAGAGGMNAHIAPGLIWGTAWWFMARDPGGPQSRRYTSGWILLAMTAGFAIAGERGWMQWHHFYDGHLSTNYAKAEYVPISRAYGFLWYFIAGSAWAGLPACFLAWCASQRPLRFWEWTLRIACGFGGGYLAWRLFIAYPDFFLPLYGSIKEKYLDFHANPGLIKLYRDCGSATRHVGFCVGFLAFEAARKDWKNVILILVVGLINGAGWAVIQNWKWAAAVWPGASFNFGRCWEVSGGISIGIGFGLAYFLVNRRMSTLQIEAEDCRLKSGDLKREWLLASVLFALIGWTMFWPPVLDLRTPNATAFPSFPLHVCGFISFALGLAYIFATIAYYRNTKNASTTSRNNRLTWCAELTLVLILGWFVRTQLVNTYSDEPADGAMGGWFGPANLYYAIILFYAVASLKNRIAGIRAVDASMGDRLFPIDLDWFATYQTLGLIVLWCISVGMVNDWHASIFFGIAGAAFGIAYYFVGSRVASQENVSANNSPRPAPDPNLEHWGAFLGLLYGLGLSLRKGVKGAANVYAGNENFWDHLAWNWIALAMLSIMLAAMMWILARRKPLSFRGNVFPHAYGIFWLMLISENILAIAVTGPMTGSATSWIDFTFNMLYAILFLLTAVIAFHCQFVKINCRDKVGKISD